MNGGTLEVTPVDVPTTSTTNGGTVTSSSETIKIFARIRPCKEQASSRGSQLRNKTYRLDGADPGEDDEPQLHFNLPKDQAQGLINNSRENYDFWFNRVFDQDTSQQEVFDSM